MGKGSAQMQAIREQLSAAQRARARVELQQMSLTGEVVQNGKTSVTMVEQVREEDFIISQPILEGRPYPLATREHFQMGFFGSDGRMTGDIQVLSRYKMSSGASGVSGQERMFYGYRMSLPEQLVSGERRFDYRVLVGYDIAPDMELRTTDGTLPYVGVLEDISEGGAKVRCRNAADKLEIGQYAYLNIDLPDPVGYVSALSRICSIKPSKVQGQTCVTLAFDKPIEALGEFIRHADIKRVARQRRTA